MSAIAFPYRRRQLSPRDADKFHHIARSPARHTAGDRSSIQEFQVGRSRPVPCRFLGRCQKHGCLSSLATERNLHHCFYKAGQRSRIAGRNVFGNQCYLRTITTVLLSVLGSVSALTKFRRKMNAKSLVLQTSSRSIGSSVFALYSTLMC